jgi:Glycosyl transferase family 2
MAAIDVLLPVKNALPYLEESIKSVMNQTFTDWRLLVLDHGSDDGSLELASRYAESDKRIQVLVAREAVGLGGLLNFGLDQADCRYVVRQDGDDISLPNRFAATVEQFEREPGLIVVGSEALIIDANGNETGYLHRPGSPAAISAAALFYNPVGHPTVGMDLSKLRRLGARYGEDILRVLPREQSMQVLSLAEDYFLFGQLALLGPCRSLKVPLIKYRYHQQSVSVSKRGAQNDCALGVSRYLAKCLAQMHGVPEFDPAPFCTHAENVFDCGLGDYRSEFAAMAQSMRRALGDSPELTRELAFRRVLAERGSISMVGRYLRFAAGNGFSAEEYRLVRNWVARFVSDKYITRVHGGLGASDPAKSRAA